MCGGRRQMSALTVQQLGGTKRRASVARVVKTRESKAKKIEADTREATESNESQVSEQIVENKVAAKRRPAKGMPQAETSEDGAELLLEGGAKKAMTTAKNEAEAAAHEASDDETDATGGAKSTSASIAVKTLTEAGKKRLVNKLLGLADTQATSGGFKITPADLIRLMQLHREMNPQKDRKVTVQWIEDLPE
jgi:hypothetical protein